MQTELNPIELPQPIHEKLGPDDDGALWLAVLDAATDDVIGVLRQEKCGPLYAVVGQCSHWLRPHQTRWTADGGFAFPFGYGEGSWGGLPEFDWSVSLCFDFEHRLWRMLDEPPTKGHRSVRIAIPARTRRHRQAAVHSIWPSGTIDLRHKRTVLYGFRMTEDGWKLTARSENGEGHPDRSEKAV
jgi:hypothetical protein